MRAVISPACNATATNGIASSDSPNRNAAAAADRQPLRRRASHAAQDLGTRRPPRSGGPRPAATHPSVLGGQPSQLPVHIQRQPFQLGVGQGRQVELVELRRPPSRAPEPYSRS